MVSHELTFRFSILTYFQLSKMDILSEGRKPGNFESHKNVKLIFTDIWSLRLSFLECKSFLESNSPDILAVCETNLDDLVYSGNFFVRGYLPLIRKDSVSLVSHMDGFPVYVKEGLPFTRYLSLEKYEDSYLCFWLALLYSMSFFFLLFQSPSLHFCTVFDAISSNIDEFLLINPSANVFVFGDFFVHHNDRLIYSGGNDRSVELCYYYYSSNDHCLKSVQIRSYF